MLLANLQLRLDQGRIGQPWREACERRQEQHRRDLINVLGQAHSRPGRWQQIEPAAIDWLRPLHLDPEEATAIKHKLVARRQREEMARAFMESAE